MIALVDLDYYGSGCGCCGETTVDTVTIVTGVNSSKEWNDLNVEFNKNVSKVEAERKKRKIKKSLAALQEVGKELSIICSWDEFLESKNVTLSKVEFETI